MPRKAIGGLLLLAAVAAGIFAWRYGLPRPAQVAAVTPAVFHRQMRGPGILDAIRKASVSANIQGVLTNVRVDIGDAVHAGDVVAGLAAEDLHAQLEAAVASHAAAGRAIELAQAERRKALAATANALSVLGRQQELMRTGATSRSVLENAETTLEQSRAEEARAQAAISQAQAAEASAAAAVKVSRAQLEKSTIRAPIDGVVVARKLNIGDLVLPGSTIVELADPESVVLSARFDESFIADVAPGQPARLLFSSRGEVGTPGKVQRISRQVDTETREFIVDVAPRQLPRNWAIGQRGTALLTLDMRENVLSVPARAIVPRGQKAGAFVLRSGRAWWQPLALGALGDAGVEVRSGLQAGDQVILTPEATYAGMRVFQEPAP
ncbi:efflux RND transporter periplasmic adaptor subunit [Xanthobacter sp. AM11]|uniref:efflux RND transporter periplasmic adaptor subunit n=1 Tax=Xanthobacter sp. AM11 TaxID=3380643 RepID=UPI0039BF3FFF